MIGIDLFAGCGGLSLGAAWAGVDVRFAVEMDRYSNETYRKNHPATTVSMADVRSIEAVDVGRRSEEEVVLFGGPPCQGFSVSNQRTRGVGNPNNWLCMEFVRLAKTERPDWVVIENVAGIMQTLRGSVVAALERELKKLGYDVAHGVVNAVHAGVPQVRNRFFLIASLNGTAPDVSLGVESKAVTVEEAIIDLPDLAAGAAKDSAPYGSMSALGYGARMRGSLDRCSGHLVTRNNPLVLERYQYVPEGGNWKDIPAQLMGNYENRSRCHTGIYHRLSWNKPAIVLGNFRKNMLIHPRLHRGLSIREAARLQSFPDEYAFCGTIGFQQQQVSNAVPPLLSKQIFRKLVMN